MSAQQIADHRQLPTHRDQRNLPRALACPTYDAAIHLGLMPEGTDPESKLAQSAQRTVRNMLRAGRLTGYSTGHRWMVSHASIVDLLEPQRVAS